MRRCVCSCNCKGETWLHFDGINRRIMQKFCICVNRKNAFCSRRQCTSGKYTYYPVRSNIVVLCPCGSFFTTREHKGFHKIRADGVLGRVGTNFSGKSSYWQEGGTDFVPFCPNESLQSPKNKIKLGRVGTNQYGVFGQATGENRQFLSKSNSLKLSSKIQI